MIPPSAAAQTQNDTSAGATGLSKEARSAQAQALLDQFMAKMKASSPAPKKSTESLLPTPADQKRDADSEGDPEEEKDGVGELPGGQLFSEQKREVKEDVSMADHDNLDAVSTSSRKSKKRTMRQAGITPVLNPNPARKTK